MGLDDPDPWRAVFLEEAALGCFVRALLRLPLTEESSLTFGLWIRVSAAEAQKIGRAWHTNDYGSLRFDGWLANDIASFGHFDAPVQVEVQEHGELPRVVSSDDPALQKLLDHESDRAEVLAAVHATGARADDELHGLDAVLTTRPVAEGLERAMLVLHAHDRTWQIIGSTDGSEDNAVVIHFSHLVERDSSLAAAHDLPPGGIMERDFVGWRRVQFASDDEMDAYLDG